MERGCLVARVRTPLTCVAIACLCALSPAHAEPASIPDTWFYNGAQRPAALKSLEGKPAPALTTETWIGDAVTLAEQRGKVVVLDFWATWCGPCIAAIPENVDLVRTHAGDDLVFVGVHDASSGWSDAPRIVKDHSIGYPVAKDAAGGPTAQAYKVQFWPTYVVIDRAGIVRAAGLMPGHVEDVVELLLAEQGPTDREIATGFGADFYYGGAGRPQALRATEGNAAPPLIGEEWLGEPSSPASREGVVTVVHFTSPGRGVSKAHLAQLAPLVREFGPQGVAFVAVHDAAGAWETAGEAMATPELTIPVLRDPPGEGAGGAGGPGGGAGVNAAAYGVRFFPTTVVIDRAGVVRASGIRTDKLGSALERLLAEPVRDARDAQEMTR